MNAGKEKLPLWILSISGIIALMEILVSFSIAIDPLSVLETVDFSATGVISLAYFWASRQFALGVIFAYATFKKSPSMLFLAYLFLGVMFLGDCIIGIVQHEMPLIITGAVMAVLSGLMLLLLSKKL
jgi:hypothetical protein